MATEIKKINAGLIDDPAQPMRSELERDGIWRLADSIRREGLINPITVRPRGDRFEVVAGHRRFTACRVAGVLDIDCVVRELSDDAGFEIMAHENLERADVDPVDEALFLGRLIGDDENKIRDVAERLNRSVAWVDSRLEILSYPDFMIAAVKSGDLKLGVAHWLNLIEDEFWRRQYVGQACAQGMTVIHAQYIYNLWKAGGSPPAADFVPGAGEGAQDAPKRATFPCAACGVAAMDPNLQIVWVHKNCPAPEDKSAAGVPISVNSSGENTPP